MNEYELPEGVTRCPETIKTITLETCSCLQFYFGENENGVPRSLAVWKDGPKNLRPFDSDKPLRNLRPGDKVWVFDQIETLTGVEIYR